MGQQLTDHSGFQINKHGSGHVLAGTCFAEEGVEGVIAATDGLVWGHGAIGLDAMLEAVQLPACIADLYTRLPNVHTDTLTLWKEEE